MSNQILPLDKKHKVLLLSFLITVAIHNILAQDARDELLGLLQIPGTKIKATADINVDPGFQKVPMYSPGVGRAAVQASVDAYYFKDQIFYKIVSAAGETVVYHEPTEGKSQYWYKGTNEVFGGYSKTSVDTIGVALSPYLIFRIYRNAIIEGSFVEVDKIDNGFKMRTKGTELVEGSPNRLYSDVVISIKNGRIVGTEVSSSISDGEKIVLQPQIVSSYSFSNFDDKFSKLAQLVTFQQFDSLPGKTERHLARKATIRVNSIEALPPGADYKTYLTKLTDGMFKYEFDEPVYRSSEASATASSTSRWLAWGGAALLILAAGFGIQNARSRKR